jgi:opacity protein-like surface antigen
MLKTFWTLLVSRNPCALRSFACGLLLCAVVGCAPRAAAQPLGLGLKLGATLTNAVTTTDPAAIPNNTTFIIGPYIEMRLPLGFSIEADALYYPNFYSSAAGGGSVWQFPVLAKLGLPLGPIRPYIEGGPSYSHLSDVKTVTDLLHESNYGITLGVGIEFKIHGFRIAPEARYNDVALTNVESPAGLFKAKHSQTIFLLSLGF